MSGSSLDGLDLALCELVEHRGRWDHRIVKARTVRYAPPMQERLLRVMGGSAMDLARLDADLGTLIGAAAKRFLSGERADLIASHGHTVFHQPSAGFSTQIGSGARIAAITGCTTVCDFRSADVALGGQGAPLVPLGEQLLFPDHSAFVNLGGICNIGLHGPKGVVGYDACIGNQALNLLAEEAGKPYDKGGAMARTGRVNQRLLEALNGLPFHRLAPPRSLGREWFDAEMLPLIRDGRIALADRLRTVTEHIAMQLAHALKDAPGLVMLTGGGAHNAFLVERIADFGRTMLVLPQKTIIDYKEALVFALLGVLRLRHAPNSLASVTGAKRDAIGGAVHLAN